MTTDSSLVEGLSQTPAGVETTGGSAKTRTSRREAFHEVIAVALQKGRNATVIFQDLVENQVPTAQSELVSLHFLEVNESSALTGFDL